MVDPQDGGVPVRLSGSIKDRVFLLDTTGGTRNGCLLLHFETIKTVVLARIAPRPPFAMAYTGGCAQSHASCGAVPRLPGYKPLVFPCGMYSAFPELRRKPLKSYRISCFRMVAARGACYNNGENQPNSVKKSASKPMTDHGRHALWFPLG